MAATTVVGGLLLATTAFGGAAPLPGNLFPLSQVRESWADSAHGWRLAGGKDAGGSYPVVQATENGGRTWHVILARGSVGVRFGISKISRSTMQNGLAFVGGRHPLLVTRDDGRHWRAIHPTPRPAPEEIEASGRDVYFATSTKLYRVPDGLLGRSAAKPLFTLPPEFAFQGLQPAPDGIAALALTTSGEGAHEFRVVLSRNGRTRSIEVGGSRSANMYCGTSAFVVAWPVIVISSQRITGQPAGACQFEPQRVVFTSRNGGAGWISSP